MPDRHMFRRSAPIFIKTELFPGLNEGSYFAGLSGLAAMKLHTPVVAPGLLKTQAQPRMLGHPVVLVQKPRQVVWVAKVCLSWCAETVPAQKTAVTHMVSNMF